MNRIQSLTRIIYGSQSVKAEIPWQLPRMEAHGVREPIHCHSVDTLKAVSPTTPPHSRRVSMSRSAQVETFWQSVKMGLIGSEKAQLYLQLETTCIQTARFGLHSDKPPIQSPTLMTALHGQVSELPHSLPEEITPFLPTISG